MLEHLKWFLPVVLELPQIVLGPTPSVAHPPEAVSEELPDICDPVIIQTVYHPLYHCPGLLRLGHVRVPGQGSLLRP